MKNFAVLGAVLLALSGIAAPAYAKGCLKGAVVGGAAGVHHRRYVRGPGARGHPAGSKDALGTILREPFGEVTILREPFGEALLAALAVGLLCFAAWRLVQAVFNPDHLGPEPTSLPTASSGWARHSFISASRGWSPP
jgi:Domain of Unknown Function (DUF1206)